MLFHLNRVPELSWLCWKTQDMLLLHFLPVKRHRGEPGHTRDTRDTRTHKGTQTNTRVNLVKGSRLAAEVGVV
jgi:hypothetical protein